MLVTFTGHSVGKSFGVFVSRFAQMSHEQADVSTETFFRLSAQVANHPLGVVHVLKRKVY